LTLSALADLATGVPYGAVGLVDARNFVTNPGYAQPQGATSEVYFYTPRDAFRTNASRRVDFAANYSQRLSAWARTAERRRRAGGPRAAPRPAARCPPAAAGRGAGAAGPHPASARGGRARYGARRHRARATGPCPPPAT